MEAFDLWQLGPLFGVLGVVISGLVIAVVVLYKRNTHLNDKFMKTCMEVNQVSAKTNSLLEKVMTDDRTNADKILEKIGTTKTIIISEVVERLRKDQRT